MMAEAAPRKFHPLVLIPFIITLAWVLMNFIAPLTLPSGSVNDLSGSVGRVDNAGQTARMNPFARWMYSSGDVNCHQKASRTLFINGNEMPYCSRDLGIFIGMMLGSLLGLFIVLDLKRWYIIGGLAPMGVDGVGQLLGFWESTNPVRLVTGGLAGFTTGIALAFIFFAIEPAIADKLRERASRKALSAAAGAGGPQRLRRRRRLRRWRRQELGRRARSVPALPAKPAAESLMRNNAPCDRGQRHDCDEGCGSGVQRCSGSNGRKADWLRVPEP